MSTGIYAIVNRDTGDRYVGQSVNIEKRWSEHRQKLGSGNASSRALQEAWNYFGEATFDFQILERCEAGELDAREQWHMLKGSSLNHETPFVEPLAIERELGIDPNDHDIELLSRDEESEINSPRELRQALEEMLRLTSQIEALVESAESFILDSKLGEDRLIEKMWEMTADNVYGVAGAFPKF